jgi:hypothetical protein
MMSLVSCKKEADPIPGNETSNSNSKIALTNVFAAGFQEVAGSSKARIWKNGIGTYLNYSPGHYLSFRNRYSCKRQ